MCGNGFDAADVETINPFKWCWTSFWIWKLMLCNCKIHCERSDFTPLLDKSSVHVVCFASVSSRHHSVYCASKGFFCCGVSTPLVFNIGWRMTEGDGLTETCHGPMKSYYQRLVFVCVYNSCNFQWVHQCKQEWHAMAFFCLLTPGPCSLCLFVSLSPGQ